MVFPSTENLWNQMAKKYSKGKINFNGTTVEWDFTELYKETKARMDKEKREDFMVKRDGSIMMYNLGII